MKKFMSMSSILALLLLTSFSMTLRAQVIMDKQGKSPLAMKFQAGSQPTVASFFTVYRQSYPLSDDNQLQPLRVSQDQKGSHHRFDQYYKGVQVLGAQFILHESGGKVWYANGHLVHGLNLDVNPILSREQALKLALDDVNAQVYKWENPGNEAFLKKLMSDEKATYFPSGELKLTSGYQNPDNLNIRLVWRFDIYAEEPLGRFWVDVDARTGDIVYKENRIHNGDVPGSGESLYYGTMNMTVDELNPGLLYRLHEYTTRPITIQTYNLQNYWDYSNVADFTSTSADGPWDPAAVNVHSCIEGTYDYYLNVHGRNSWDNLGGAMISFVHYGTNYDNAFWDGAVMTFGDGDGYWDGPLVSYDVVAHELSHGFTQASSNLIYYCESGALNESFSDIFGNLVEFYYKGEPGIGTGSWHIGEDFALQGQGGFRNMADPNEYYNPDTYLGDFWVLSNGGDNGGVHSNSGVQNFWFYLLSTGGTGTNDLGFNYDVTGIGIDDAAVIAYFTNNSYLYPYSDFHDARNASIAFTEFWFGSGSQQAVSVADAWDAVGVYDFEVPENDLCENAIEIYCNDLLYGTTVGSTFDPDAPWCDFEHNTRGVWYKFAGNGKTMLASMCGGPVYDARMTVYSGNCDQLTCVAANDDACGIGNVSQVLFYAEPETEYYILIHGFNFSDGQFQLSLSSMETPAIATSPGELNFVVPFQGSGSGQLSISGEGEDCMANLVWWMYNSETEPLLNSEVKREQQIKEISPVQTESLKPGDFVKENFGHNIITADKMLPEGPPVLISGNASSPGREIMNNDVTVTLTHNLDQSIMVGNSIACWNGVDATTDNSYWRAFNLLDYGITGNFEVTNVEIGVEVALFVYVDLYLTVNLYTSEGGPFPYGILNPIGSATYAISDQSLTMLSLPVTGMAHVGSELVVEIFSPGGSFFIIGSNNLGQTDASYISAWDCGAPSPIDLASIGFPGMHVLMNVTGSYESNCPWLSIDPHIGVIPPGSTSDVSINVDAAGLFPGLYTCNLIVGGNGSNAGEVMIPVTMEVVDITPPVIMVADPITLWPPNHKYQNLSLMDLIVSITDDVDGNIPVTSADIMYSTSDEPDDAPGLGDGKTINDMMISMDCKSVDLRIERSGELNGRVYTVWVSVSDNAGNMATAPVLVTVPLDMETPAYDDGVSFQVNSNCFGPSMPRVITGLDENNPVENKISVYPNPFNGTTNFEFTLKESGLVALDLYDVVGKKVASVYQGEITGGLNYRIIYNGHDLPDGVYFFRLISSNGTILTNKIFLFR